MTAMSRPLLGTNAAGRASAFFSEEHDILRDQVRRFVEEEVKPHGDAWESQGFVPRPVLRRMGELGFFGIRYDEAYGGSAMDTLATAVLAEELGRSTYSGFAITALVHTDMASVHLYNAGSAAQRERWMPKVIAGEAICAVAVTEPDAGSDVKGIRTTARQTAGGWVLNGTKMFITNGVHADLYCVAAKSGPLDGGSKAVTMFLVEKGTPGFRVSRALDKHGWRSSDTASCRTTPSSVTRGAASTRSCGTSRTSASSSAPWRSARLRPRST
jgi:acyl-CoA dehydrogenase